MTAFIARSSDGKRTFYLAQDQSDGDSGSVRGWSFVVEENLPDGEVRPLFDTWHETFDEVLMYPPEYSTEALRWQDEATGAGVDLKRISNSHR